MKTQLTINQHNIQAHMDIERDIQNKKNGLFTFNLRIHQGNIEDYAQYETITSCDYGEFIYAFFEEYTVTRDTRDGNTTNAVRPGNR